MIQVNIQVEEMRRVRYVGRSMELPFSLQECHSPNASMRSPTQRLSEPHTIGMFMETLSHRHNLSLTPFPAPLPSGEWGLGLEISSF